VLLLGFLGRRLLLLLTVLLLLSLSFLLSNLRLLLLFRRFLLILLHFLFGCLFTLLFQWLLSTCGLLLDVIEGSLEFLGMLLLLGEGLGFLSLLGISSLLHHGGSWLVAGFSSPALSAFASKTGDLVLALTTVLAGIASAEDALDFLDEESTIVQTDIIQSTIEV